MIDPRNLDSLLHPTFDQKALKAATPIAKALGAAPGAACGKIVFPAADDAVEWAARGEKVVLVRLETSPEDITGMEGFPGYLNRSWWRWTLPRSSCCAWHGRLLCSRLQATSLWMKQTRNSLWLAKSTMRVMSSPLIRFYQAVYMTEAIPTVEATIAGGLRAVSWRGLMSTEPWASPYQTQIPPHDAQKARELGAEGIGLCRTEHMFFEGHRIDAFRAMICSDTVAEREEALEKILPLQQGDFEQLLRGYGGQPCNHPFPGSAVT